MEVLRNAPESFQAGCEFLQSSHRNLLIAVLSTYHSEYDMAPKYSSPAQEQYSEKPKTLNLWDSIELVQTTVDTARESIQQIAGGTGDIAESLKPKLTADLAGKHLDKFPLELIEIIQIDVERYGALMPTSRAGLRVTCCRCNLKDMH